MELTTTQYKDKLNTPSYIPKLCSQHIRPIIYEKPSVSNDIYKYIAEPEVEIKLDEVEMLAPPPTPIIPIIQEEIEIIEKPKRKYRTLKTKK